MVRCKMTQGQVTEVPCLLDLTIGLRLTLDNMSEQSLKKMGFSWASWTHWRPQGGGATGAMAPPLAREGGAILSFGPTFEVKEKR